MLPGHTHEDIDGVFSLVATSLASAADIQTPADIRRRVLHSLSPLFAKRGWNFTVEMVDTVRDWAAMAPSTVTFKNCFKIRQQQDESDTVPVPHSFNFMARQDMPGQGSWYESMLDGGPENVGTVPDLSFLKNAPTAVKDLVMTGTPAKRLTTLVPNSSTDEFYLPLYCFDYSPTGKNGCHQDTSAHVINKDPSERRHDKSHRGLQPPHIGAAAPSGQRQDFSRRASKEFSQKAKAKVFQFIQFCQVKPIRLPALPLPLQKSQQLDEEGQILLHDTACLWIWLSSKLKGMFSSETMDKFQKLFDEGKSAKKEEEPDPSIKKEEDDSDAEKDEGKDDDEEILLRDMRYKLEADDDLKAEEPPRKRIKVENCTHEHVSTLTNVWSFGSGEWRDGQDAVEVMDNVEGRWFSFSPQMSDLIILEKGTVPSHLSTIENLDKAVTVTSILSDLADHGEVKVNISHHELKDGGIKRVKELVFVLDEPESNRKKKKKTVTAKNLGSFMNIPKLKANDTTMELTWRCRRWMG
ncbi:unnamed protein product [Durusdinium trenchii]|uniref:DUF7869 domain-containing protein n=1 Tax=Durusdinium trenchii TaxID=1381693 RepID=A0ABP0PE19_9DINO